MSGALISLWCVFFFPRRILSRRMFVGSLRALLPYTGTVVTDERERNVMFAEVGTNLSLLSVRVRVKRPGS